MRSNHRDIPPLIPPSAGVLIANKFLDSVAKSFPTQEVLGAQKLHRARECTQEFESVISESDRLIIEEKITQSGPPFP